MFTIDGVTWAYPCDITRKAQIQASDISGLLLDGSFFNDVIGTYMVYGVKISVPFGKESDYAGIYGLLTEPVDGHSFIMPYNGTTITITGRVDAVKDKYYRDGDGQYWQNVEFNITANHPSRTMSLGDVISRGMSPLPEISAYSDGTIIQLQNGDWVELTLTDGHYYQYTASTHTLADANLTDGDEVAY